jgi:hypothetical protein
LQIPNKGSTVVVVGAIVVVDVVVGNGVVVGSFESQNVRNIIPSAFVRLKQKHEH